MTGTIEAYAEAGNRKLIVSIPDHKIALVEDGQVKKIYAVAVGKPSTPSPVGSFQIVARIPDPTWYTRGKVVGPGKANPLGTRWLGLSEKGYGIHGTNVPSSIGRSASHGCIRMKNRDVEELFALVSVGDTVELVGSPSEDISNLFREASIKSADKAAVAVGGAE
jgi:lipoprotein-anchoring transpeptidase ErfK/SrfK